MLSDSSLDLLLVLTIALLISRSMPRFLVPLLISLTVVALRFVRLLFLVEEVVIWSDSLGS